MFMVTRWRSMVGGWLASKDDIVAVQQVFALLGMMADHGEVDAQQLAAKTGLAMRTTQRLLHTVARLGYLRKSGSSWRLTLRAFELGARAQWWPDIVEVARPVMRDLARASGETVALSLLDADEFVHVQRIETHEATGVCIPIGSIEPQSPSIIGRGRHLCQVRRLPHVCSLRMSLRSYNGQAVGGLSIHVPTGRADEARIVKLMAELKAAAVSISRGLGYIWPHQSLTAGLQVDPDCRLDG